MNITIKPMETAEETDGKAYVHWKSWHETYENLVSREYLDALTLDKCTEIARRWRDNIYVAKDGERVIGFVGYGRCGDSTMEDCGEVYAIYILREYYGKKVGYALMQTALELLEDERLGENKKIVLWVLKGNERAIRFYEKCGFIFDGAEKKINLCGENTELRMILKR